MNKKNLEKYLNKQLRFSKKDKLKFADQLISDFEDLNYKGIVDRRKVGIKKVNNILVGNFKTARNILVVPYDSPRKIFWPKYKFFPQEGNLAMRANFVPYYTPMLLSYMLLLGLVYIVPNFIGPQAQGVLISFSLIYFTFLMILIARGFGNKNNTVRCDTSIALAYEIAESLDNNKRKELAFVFTDSNTMKMQGSQALEAYLASIKRNPTKIVLYCIGSGDRISVAYQKGNRKNAQDIVKKYKGDYKLVSKSIDASASTQLPIEHLSNAMMISSGTLYKDDLCVYDLCTSKDKVYDESILDQVKTIILNYLK